jgi:hypothetical protein
MAWVGIGGVKSQDLIQAGSASEYLNGSPHYHAWYELLPSPEVPLTGCTPIGTPTGPVSDCPVHAGDEIAVSIFNTPQERGHWSISISDQGPPSGTGNAWTWTSPDIDYPGSAEAEWILEAPKLLSSGGVKYQTTLPGLSRTTFAGGFERGYGPGSSHAIGQGSPVKIVMDFSGKREATPSSMDTDTVYIKRSGDHTSSRFNVCAWTTTCPAPR